MAADVRAIRTYFSKLGLDKEIADIYLALHSYGPQSISQLSRNAHVERTRIYRLIDQLMESNLIEVESHNTRGIIKAAPIANLHILIAQKAQELKSLQDELGLIEQVLARNSLSSPAGRVQVYDGPEATKQIWRNAAAATSEVLAVLYKDLSESMDADFRRRWVESVNQHENRLRIIYAADLQRSPLMPTGTASPRTWESRAVAKDTFPVSHSSIIYDDVIASFYWQDTQVFGMEIYNSEAAKAQRAYFELLWAKAATS
jgi:sugar-specific transcriptional regulator TrmB